MVNAFHGRQTIAQGIHGFAAFEYADEAARLAAGPFETYDVNKVARQLDDDTFWILIDPAGPTWQSFAAFDGPVVGQDGYLAIADSGNLIYLPFDEVAPLEYQVSLVSGVVSGGIITINGGDPLTFDISSGVGYIVDYWTDPENPEVYTVNIGGTGISVTNIATQSATFVMLDVNGDVVQLSEAPTPQQRRDNLFLGQLGHANNVSISTALANYSRAFSVKHNLEDLEAAIGTINNGITIAPFANDLRLERSDGYIFSLASNIVPDEKNPNFVEVFELSPATFRMRTQTGAGGAPVSILDVGNYDVGGVITPLPGTSYQNFRVFNLTSGNIVIQYGQVAYNTLTDAIGNILTEEFVPISNVIDGVLIGIISASSDAVDLTNELEVMFTPVSKFGIPIISSNPTALNNTYRGWDGAVVEDPSTTVTSDGTTVVLNLEKSGGGNLTAQISGNYFVFEDGYVELTAGTDTNPVLNYVYLVESAGVAVLEVSTVNFPDGPHVPVATVFAQSPTSVQAEEVYKLHGWTDHVFDEDENGHISHINKWIRFQDATWISGAALTPSITTNGGSADNVNIAVTDGYVLQLHDQFFPSKNTAIGDSVYVVNDSTTPYRTTTDLNTELTDSTGSTMVDRYFSLVIWGVVSQNSIEDKLFLNLPGGSYGNEESLLSDFEGYANRSVPSEFKGTAFLIAQLNFQHESTDSGTWTLISNIDLRGVMPTVATSGGGGGSATAFADSNFLIFDDADPTKELVFVADNISAATTRTITMADADVDLSLVLSHASRHETGGADPLDGYNVDLVYSPSNYTSPVNDIIGEHLAAIDDAIGFNSDADVSGPATATDNAIARFDGTSGKVIQNSLVTISDTGSITLDSAVISPFISQADDATPATAGDRLTIQAQNMTGGTTVGGELWLTSGSGTSDGDVVILTGGNLAMLFDEETATSFAAAEDGYVLVYNSTNNAVEYVPPSTVGATDHGALTGLLDDDHTQYLLVDGTRAMSGNLDMGSNNIISVGLVDGVDVSTHASRHENGGADEINVGGLSGLLADPQTPLAHASTHETGGADALDGYNIDLVYTPINYSDPVNDLIGEHIAAIDEALAGAIGTGDVNGPGSSTDNAIVRFDGVTGKLIQNSSVLLTDSGNINFESTVVTPELSQTDDTIASATGDTLTVQAQNATGATSTGGDLHLTSGTGTSTDGEVEVQVGGLVAAIFDENTVLTLGSAEDGYALVYNSGTDALEYRIQSETNRIVMAEFALTEDAFNFSPYFFTWRSTGSDSTNGKRSTAGSGMSTPNACNPFVVPFDATITRAILVVRGVGVQNGSVTYPVSYRVDLLDVGFTGNTKIADVDFSISNSFTVGTYSVGNTNFRGGMDMNLDVDEGDTLALQFNHGVGASIAGQTRMAFVTFVLEER